jgi:F-type H+-transporting ATPase subunit b
MMKRFFFYMMLLAMAEPAIVRAAEEAAHETHGEGIMGWVWKIVNFAILVFILVKFLGKPMRDYFKKRTELIEQSLKQAQEAKAMAEKALKEVQEKLRLKDEEVERIIATARSSGEAEKAEMIEEGRRMAEKIKEQARENIAMELASAREALRVEAAEIALKLAEKKLREELDEDTQKRLIEDSLKRLEGGN